MICELCKTEYKNIGSLGCHLSHHHKEYSKEKYYVTFLNSKAETICHCGKPLEFMGLRLGYRKTCSLKCGRTHPDRQVKINKTLISKHGSLEKAYANRLVKTKQTNLKRYGTENPSALEEIQNKIKKVNLEKYGVEYAAQSIVVKEKAKKTNLERYGVEYAFQSKEVKRKIKATHMKNHGVEYVSQIPEVKANKIKTSLLHYGVDYPMRDSKVMNKMHQTKKDNGTYKKSLAEDLIYDKLVKCFHMYTIERQYSSKEYPFQCDFYVQELGLYIEFQGSWTHGKEPFINSEDQQEELLRLRIKSNDSKYYKNALYTWTVRDVNKRKIAIDNKLIYIELFSIEEAQSYIDETTVLLEELSKNTTNI